MYYIITIVYSIDEWIVDKIFEDYDSSDVDEYLLILAREGNGTSYILSDVVTGDIINAINCTLVAMVMIDAIMAKFLQHAQVLLTIK